MNQLRGYKKIQIGDYEYTGRLSTNALCMLEELTGEDATSTLQTVASNVAAQKINFKAIRATLWASLTENHPQFKLQDCGPLLDQAGVVAIIRFLTELIAITFSAPEESAGDPPKPGVNGTGMNSTTSG